MATSAEPLPDTIRFSLDGVALTAYASETILQAAKRHGTKIPHLCYQDGLRADGNCRACMVEIEGEGVLAPACCRTPTEEMVVHSSNERAVKAQKMVLELLQADMPENRLTLRNELDFWSERIEVGASRFPQRPTLEADASQPGIQVDLNACIHCTRCLRACRETQVNDVIGFAFRGSDSKIVFDCDDSMGDSSCVGCGECVQACPTGALMPADGVGLVKPEQQVDSVCPYCGVGCLLTYNVKDNEILYIEGNPGPANQGRLCIKGRYGFDYVKHPHRLLRPLIRRKDMPKTTDMRDFDPANRLQYFREADWDEALDFAARGLRRIRDDIGSQSLAGFGSAKGSNEEAYLFQKLVRTGFGTNNVDHCTRLCHASSVAALLEMIGSGAVSNPVADVSAAEVIVVIGANAAWNHPVAATFFKNAAKEGKTLIVMDPRATPLARHAHYFLQFKPDTDVALLNAMMHTIIAEDLIDTDFIATRTEGYAELKTHLKDFSPERMERVCGIDADRIRNIARIYAASKGSMIFWGMGISQHVHGTDNARALISLTLMTGQIGRPGTGLHPLRGQNNVQGASDVGLIPMVFPDYQRVDNPVLRERFEQHWSYQADPNPGLTVVEIMHAITDGKIHGMYIMGENPAMSDPNLNHARKALASLNHLVVQDLFLTETAFFADVILPASAFPEKTGTFTNTDRRVQLGRQALNLPGDTRQDLWIIQEIASRLGLAWNYEGPQAVFNEMRKVMPSITGITWERLQRDDSVTYPCVEEGDPGDSVIFTQQFPTANGLARFVASPFTNADELPDNEYPYVLITGRQLEHWHTGAMTRRAKVLDAIEPNPVAFLHPDDLKQIEAQPGEPVRLTTRRGQVQALARADEGMQPGQVYLPFCYHEAAANLLTNEALDPYGKIPEFKFCALQIASVKEATT